MDANDAMLIVERGPNPSSRHDLEAEQVTIGRSAGNDFIIADPEVSRRHARIVRREDGFAVEDIGSTNGTFVNGQRISHLTLLQDGDTIDLGDTVRLRFLWAGATAVSPAVQQPAENRPRPDSPARPPAANPPVYAPAAPPAQPVEVSYVESAGIPAFDNVYAALPPPVSEPRRGRGLLIGCGLLVALMLVCAGTFLLLDAYDQGRLLYCGPIAPLFNVLLGPLGFAPICP